MTAEAPGLWVTQGACKDNPEGWHTTHGLISDLRQAAHVCVTHCPVLNECRNWSQAGGEWVGCVVGGLIWGRDGKPITYQEPDTHCALCTGQTQTKQERRRQQWRESRRRRAARCAT